MNRNREKNTHSQTSRLENPEGLQLHHNHEKILFLTVLLLFAQRKMHYWWLVTWLDLSWLVIPGCWIRSMLKSECIMDWSASNLPCPRSMPWPQEDSFADAAISISDSLSDSAAIRFEVYRVHHTCKLESFGRFSSAASILTSWSRRPRTDSSY
jgi:hypothetical protein